MKKSIFFSFLLLYLANLCASPGGTKKSERIAPVFLFDIQEWSMHGSAPLSSENNSLANTPENNLNILILPSLFRNEQPDKTASLHNDCITDKLAIRNNKGKESEPLHGITPDHPIEVLFQPAETPTIIVSDTATMHFSSKVGMASEQQYILLTGQDLIDSIRANISSPFEVLSDDYWGDSQVFSSDTVLLFIRYKPTSTGNDEGVLTIFSQGVAPITIRLMGEASSRTFTFNIQHSSGGIISPSNDTSVTEGSDIRFLFIPAEGHYLKILAIDQEFVDSTLSYTFSNVNRNHSLYAYFEQSTGTISWIDENAITLYPNPAHQFIGFSGNLPEEKLHYVIYLSNGSPVSFGMISSFNEKIDISGLGNGLYFIRIKGMQHSLIRKFVKI